MSSVNQRKIPKCLGNLYIGGRTKSIILGSVIVLEL